MESESVKPPKCKIGRSKDYNLTKSQVMFYDTLKIGEAANIMLGDTVLY